MGFSEDDRIRHKNREYNKEEKVVITKKDTKKAFELLESGNYNEYIEHVNKIRKEMYDLPPIFTKKVDQ